MTALPLAAAAAELGASPATLRRWVRQGAPVARRGRSGPGGSTMVCPIAIRAWRAAQSANADAEQVARAALLAFAAGLPDLLAAAVAEAHRLAPDKRGAAWTACCAWQLAVNAVGDQLEARGVRLPDAPPPEGIVRLVKLAHRMIGFSTPA